MSAEVIGHVEFVTLWIRVDRMERHNSQIHTIWSSDRLKVAPVPNSNLPSNQSILEKCYLSDFLDIYAKKTQRCNHPLSPLRGGACTNFL